MKNYMKYASLSLEIEEILGRDNTCKLRKSSYGSKQSLMDWLESFGSALKN